MTKLQETTILSALPKHIKFLSRDEKGDLWVTKERPSVDTKESDGGKILNFGETSMENIDDIFSLAVYNHLFSHISQLDVLELDHDKIGSIGTNE